MTIDTNKTRNKKQSASLNSKKKQNIVKKRRSANLILSNAKKYKWLLKHSSTGKQQKSVFVTINTCLQRGFDGWGGFW